MNAPSSSLTHPRAGRRFLRPLRLGAALGLAAVAWSRAAELPKRVYTAVAVTGAAPVIDGRLDDACWQQGEWAGDYLQREPFEGAAPSLPTRIKILYDHRNLYVAFRATDPDVARQPRWIGQRDEFSGDMVGIAFDSYLNRQTAFEFDVTSGGSKIDLVIRNDASVDTDWNPIWDVRVATDAEGWTAEYRIPLTQLRYSRSAAQVWGMHSWRWIRRRQEESDWQPIPMDHKGFVRSFGELRGIRDLPPTRRIELMPFAAAKYETREKQAGNPYRTGGAFTGDGGLDAKIGVSSDFTLDLTVNPDFGQVEADPAQINLSTVETFFPEKRPFFIEGKATFEYGLDDDMAFYSRRIGDAPSLVPNSSGFVKMPANNRILAAEKITGRSAGGFSLGVVHALTDRSEAQILEPGGDERRVLAEPRTNYFVSRLQNDFDGGDTLIGGILTATLRQGSEDELAQLPKQALVGGLDATRYWDHRTYFVEGRTLFSQVKGSAGAIAALMDSPVHNFGRPDADYLNVSGTATTLSGNAGRIRSGKGSGRWRWSGGANWRSPGVDFNDLGYLANADYFQPVAQLQFYDPSTWRGLRRRDFRLKQLRTYNYGRELLQHSTVVQAEISGLGGWYGSLDTRFETSRMDMHMLRGGPALRREDRFPTWVYAETDGGRSTQGRLSAGYVTIPRDGSRYYEVEPGIVQKLGDRVRLDLRLGYGHSLQQSQYAGQGTAAGERRYVVGHLDQKTLWSQLRLQTNFTPTLSLTYFAGPYASVGRFNAFRLVTNPRADRNASRYAELVTSRTGGGVVTQYAGQPFRIDEPDFDWRELNSNFVLKWEFRPGSTLYCVWSQHRGDSRGLGDFSYGDEFRQMLQAHPDNTFLVKASYWFSI
jgi:hypothetical protein